MTDQRGGRGRAVTLLALVAVLGGLALVGRGLTEQERVPAAPLAVGSVTVDGTSQVLGMAPLTEAQQRKVDRRRERARREGPDLAAIPGLDGALPPSPPRALRIPAIDLDTDVFGIGRTRDGALQVPQPGPREDLAAWYRHSATPGSLGPSIIEGHVDTPRGPSVFFRLGEVRPGDLVQVERRDGWQLSYEVTGVRTVRKEVFPTELVYGAGTGVSTLRLITCALFDDEARTHRGNQIVFADLVRARPPAG